MSFTFVEHHSFEWPVTISVPAESEHKDITITGLFSCLDDVEFYAPPDPEQDNGAGIDQEIERQMRVFKGWKSGDIKDAAGKDFEPTDANIRKILAYRPARLGVSAAYQKAMTPTKGFRAKN